VDLGAVVVVPNREDLAAVQETQSRVSAVARNPRPFYSSRMPILGNDVLHSWTERVRKVGVQTLWLTASACDDSAACVALPEFARAGVEQLLLIKLKSYAEIDLADLLRFHCERRNPVTEAHDEQGQLGVCLLNPRELPLTGEHEFFPPTTSRGRIPYQFRGYAKRILAARERQELVGDGLTGACAMRPFGTQIRDQVWIGEGVSLADSVRVNGPTYIGARTIVRAGATIGPFASVESDCVVDCGTTVERSTVLPQTYLAPGLLIRHKLVDGRYLEDLASGVVADLQPAGLGGRIDRRASGNPAVHEQAIDFFPRAAGAFAQAAARSAAATQPWLQVHL
jgi:carbonic anhydrase/acetyltransferase-like protein (isoleucine patch superfamily)